MGAGDTAGKQGTRGGERCGLGGVECMGARGGGERWRAWLDGQTGGFWNLGGLSGLGWKAEDSWDA